MKETVAAALRTLAPVLAVLSAASCDTDPGAQPAGPSSEVRSMGSFEVTARLEEIPEGAIFKRDLYDYTTILKYTVLEVHRGAIEEKRPIWVGHYNPFKPRAGAADRFVKGIGGSVRRFEAGAVHRMALEAPLEEHFMGGIIDKYFGKSEEPLYWAVWTDPGEP